MFRDQPGRVIYIGRSRDLARRVRSYWSDLGERPHLRRMIQRAAWVEPVLCSSEHEAAFLESDLLERHPTRYNRTLGMESCVYLRLDANPQAPTFDVVHQPFPQDGALWFGPYLGWEAARQAVGGLLRLYPLQYSGTRCGRSEREMARTRGFADLSTAELAERIQQVLLGDRQAVTSSIRRLQGMRNRASRLLMFELAQQIQEQIRGLLWISQPQKLARLKPSDHDYGAVAAVGDISLLVILQVRGGHFAQRRVVRLSGAESELAATLARYRGSHASRQPVRLLIAEPGEHDRDRSPKRDWLDLAQANAALMARLVAAGAVGPVDWRPLPGATAS